jgi:hypothetical protein
MQLTILAHRDLDAFDGLTAICVYCDGRLGVTRDPAGRQNPQR